MQRLCYPPTRKVDQVDYYHGVRVADPYRWLEAGASAEVAAWAAAQSAVTESHLAATHARGRLRRRFEKLLDYPRYYDLIGRDGYLLFARTSGLQKQLTLFVQEASRNAPEILVDPTRDAVDGTTRIAAFVPSRDGHYLGFSLSREGSDWEEYFIKDMTTRKELTDRIRWVKVSTFAWRGDGFYYSRFPADSARDGSSPGPNKHHQVCYHRVGTPQSADILVYEDRAHPLHLNMVQTTEDERFAVLHVFDGGGVHGGKALWAMDLTSPTSGFMPIATSFEDDYILVDSEGSNLLLLTNRHAPNWRVVRVDPLRPDVGNWEDVIPECGRILGSVVAGGPKLFATYRTHAVDSLQVFDRSGNKENEIALPGPGTARVFPARRRDTEVFWSFSSFTMPVTTYRYHIAARTSTVFHRPRMTFDPGKYTSKQIFYPSTGGVRIPMFIVHKKGLRLTGRHRLLLEAYGGNGMSVGPSFDPLLLALLERGVVYAAPCLRGGGEYGEPWHRAGCRDKKQNVFDDCIAAAEWLERAGYSDRARSALLGVSNGGLLVGAVMTQRPDIFSVALPAGPVMDMLRFQEFTIGPAWTAEYGCSDEPQMFPILFAYSPLHNIKPGMRYPATLVTTSLHDDRVAPAHAFKFIATLQERGSSARPYLIRVQTGAGHGPVSLPQLLDERADTYAFMLMHTRVTRTARQSGRTSHFSGDVAQ